MKSGLLLLLLSLYVLIVLAAQTSDFQGDEGRYVMFANNLLHGFYSPSDPDKINLWNGPGYPIVLLPFIILKLPLLTAKLLNAFFLLAVVIYFYHTLRLYMRKQHAELFSCLIGLYPPFLLRLHFLLTEIFVFFIMSGFIYHFCKLHRNDGKHRLHLFAASLYLGYLALTKVFFGYVITIGLLLFLFLYVWKKRSHALKKTLLVYSLAFLLCLPYLFYTYSLTGKIFYWGNSGGMSLYWMSSPYDDELGDWITREYPHGNELFKKHQDFFNEAIKLPPIQMNDEFQRRAIHNIVNNPLKYFRNWLANIGRLFFNYPFSERPQQLTTYIYIIPNMFLLVVSAFCFYPSYLRRKFIPYEINALLLFGIISFLLTSLVTAYNRQFQPLVPIFCLWIFFTLTNFVKVEIRQ